MKKAFYDRYFANSQLLDCFPVTLEKMIFVSKDVPNEVDVATESSDADLQTPQQDYTRAVTFVPGMVPAGEYGIREWSGIGYDLRAGYGPAWLLGCSSFQINEPKVDKRFHKIQPNEYGYRLKGFAHVDGFSYAYGMVRTVFRRADFQHWDNLTLKTNHPELREDIDKTGELLIGHRVGFAAMDGFRGDDLYAGGNRGDFWHFDGQIWRKIDLASNTDISSVVCAPDERVYVSCNLVPVMVGRGDQWKIIDRFKQITHGAWFDGAPYFVDANGRIYTHVSGEEALVEAKFASDFPKYMYGLIRGVASCQECLVAYTNDQAYAYDGKEWHEIIELPSLSKIK